MEKNPKNQNRFRKQKRTDLKPNVRKYTDQKQIQKSNKYS